MYNFITPINCVIIFGCMTQVKHVHLPISYYLIHPKNKFKFSAKIYRCQNLFVWLYLYYVKN